MTHQLCYPDGRTITVGDRVWWDGGVGIGYVREVFADAEAWSRAGLSEPSLLIGATRDSSIPSGLVCYPIRALGEDGIGLLSESEEGEVENVLAAIAALCGQSSTSNLGLSCTWLSGRLEYWTAIKYDLVGIAAFRVPPSLTLIEPLDSGEIGFLFRPTGGGRST